MGSQNSSKFLWCTSWPEIFREMPCYCLKLLNGSFFIGWVASGSGSIGTLNVLLSNWEFWARLLLFLIIILDINFTRWVLHNYEHFDQKLRRLAIMLLGKSIYVRAKWITSTLSAFLFGLSVTLIPGTLAYVSTFISLGPLPSYMINFFLGVMFSVFQLHIHTSSRYILHISWPIQRQNCWSDSIIIYIASHEAVSPRLNFTLRNLSD